MLLYIKKQSFYILYNYKMLNINTTNIFNINLFNNTNKDNIKNNSDILYRINNIDTKNKNEIDILMQDIFKTYKGYIHQVIYNRIRTSNGIEDMVQDVFLEIFKSISSGRTNGKTKSITAYISSIIHHLINTSIRLQDFADKKKGMYFADYFNDDNDINGNNNDINNYLEDKNVYGNVKELVNRKYKNKIIFDIVDNLITKKQNKEKIKKHFGSILKGGTIDIRKKNNTKSAVEYNNINMLKKVIKNTISGNDNLLDALEIN